MQLNDTLKKCALMCEKPSGNRILEGLATRATMVILCWVALLPSKSEAQLDRFGPQQVLTSGSASGASCVYAIDLDGDGDKDVLSASEFDGKIAWYENRLHEEAADFAPQQVITTDAEGAKSVFAIDLDGDGDADVLSASQYDDKIAWYENRLSDQEADFAPQQVITESAKGASSVYAVDLDGDGDADVISASLDDSRIAWYENRLDEEQGGFGPQQVITTDAIKARSVFATDLDGDGDSDVLSASRFDNKIAWYENRLMELEADFGPQQVINEFDLAMTTVFAIDLDNDGDLDVLSASDSNSVIVWYQNRLSEEQADFGPQEIISTEAIDPEIVFATDLDRDGNAEVLSASSGDHKVAWYENRLSDPEGNFGPQRVINTDTDGPNSAITVDIDGDGDPDVLTSSRDDDKIAWFQNRLTEEEKDFGPQQLISTVADSPNAVLSVDLDGDGDPDVLTSSNIGDKIAWYKNRLSEEEKSFGPKEAIISNEDFLVTGVRSLLAKDLDRDGDQDIIFILLSASSSENRIVWIENRLSESEGDFGPQVMITNEVDEPESVFAMDLDGDGDADLLSASSRDNKIAWYENRITQKEGDFGPQRVISTNADGAFNVLSVDLDGDGDADVLSASDGDHKIAWYENRLSEDEQDFGPQQLIGTELYSTLPLFAVDLDGDNDADILSISGNEIINLVWYENRLSEQEEDFGPQQVFATNALRTSSIHASDLDLDGDADVLLASDYLDRIAWHENIGSAFALRGQQEWDSIMVEPLTSPDLLYDENEGSLVIEAVANDSLYGLWESPSVTIDPAEEPSIFRTRWRLSSSIDPPRYVPTIRLRTSTEDFSRSDLLVATSAGPGLFSPRYYDTDYTQYSTQPLAPQDYRFSFEMLNVDPTDAAEGSVSLHYLQIDQLAESRLGNSQIVLDHNFETATGASLDWESYSDFSETFPAPEEFTDQNGLLIRGVVPSDVRVPYYELIQFGYWNTQTDLPLSAGKTYRVRYTVASDATVDQRAFVPTFRLRASDSSFMMGHVVNIDSVNAEANIPVAGEDVTYDLWFLCPEAVDGNYLNLSFDYLYVEKDTPDADDPTIALKLKRVEVEEWGR